MVLKRCGYTTDNVLYLDGREEVGINLCGKLRFQQAISFVLANLAGTLVVQRCLKVALLPHTTNDYHL